MPGIIEGRRGRDQANGDSVAAQYACLGESPTWEAAYRLTRRSEAVRLRRLSFFNWEPKGGLILDLGAGDGLDAAILRGMGHCNIVAVDISPGLVETVPGRRVVADAHRLPFASGVFDMILADAVLHHFDLERALPEMSRVLRVGGRICMMEPRPCAARRLLDWFTLDSYAWRLSRTLAARRVCLLEEYDAYSRWLRLYSQVEGRFARLGFVAEKKKNILFGVLLQWRKIR